MEARVLAVCWGYGWLVVLGGDCFFVFVVFVIKAKPRGEPGSSFLFFFGGGP